MCVESDSEPEASSPEVEGNKEVRLSEISEHVGSFCIAEVCRKNNHITEPNYYANECQ